MQITVYNYVMASIEIGKIDLQHQTISMRIYAVFNIFFILLGIFELRFYDDTYNVLSCRCIHKK